MKIGLAAWNSDVGISEPPTPIPTLSDATVQRVVWPAASVALDDLERKPSSVVMLIGVSSPFRWPSCSCVIGGSPASCVPLVSSGTRISMTSPTSPLVMFRASITRSTLRSVKLLIELPACSKKAQNSIEKNVRISTTNMRWRSIVWLRNASTISQPNASAPNGRSSSPAMSHSPSGPSVSVLVGCTSCMNTGTAISVPRYTGHSDLPLADGGARPAFDGTPPRFRATNATKPAATSATPTKMLMARL